MAKHLIVLGHGYQPNGKLDPGAVGNGTSEFDFTRGELLPVLRKYATSEIDIYDTQKDMYGYRTATSVSGYASVTEIHLDAASPAATGGHVIYKKGYSPDAQDTAIRNLVVSITGGWNNGWSARDDLYNLNTFASRGIAYRLVELGFISNASNVNALRKDIDRLGKGLIEAITGKGAATPSTPAPAPKPPVTPTPTPKPPVTPPKTGWVGERGTFVLGQGLPLTVDDSGRGALIANIGRGNSINYDAYRIDYNGYVWIRQPRAGGAYGYMATGESVNGKRKNYWGTFK